MSVSSVYSRRGLIVQPSGKVTPETVLFAYSAVWIAEVYVVLMKVVCLPGYVADFFRLQDAFTHYLHRRSERFSTPYETPGS